MGRDFQENPKLVGNRPAVADIRAAILDAPAFMKSLGISKRDIGEMLRRPLGSGVYAYAFALDDGRVLKVTDDPDDAMAAEAVRRAQEEGRPTPGLPKIYDVRRFRGEVLVDEMTDSVTRPIFAIVTEYVTPLRDMTDDSKRKVLRDLLHYMSLHGVYTLKEAIGEFGGEMKRFAQEAYRDADLRRRVDDAMSGVQWLYRAGFEVSDLHLSNIGVVAGDRGVVFDFGHHSNTGTGVDIKLAKNATKKVIAYHGTKARFERFRDTPFGVHFGTAEAARERLGAEKLREQAGRPRVLKVALSISNPLRLRDARSWGPYHVYDMMRSGRSAIRNRDDIPVPRTGDADYLNTVVKYLKGLGYDGIVYRNEYEDRGSDSYIPFSAEQVTVLAEDELTSNGAANDTKLAKNAQSEGWPAGMVEAALSRHADDRGRPVSDPEKAYPRSFADAFSFEETDRPSDWEWTFIPDVPTSDLDPATEADYVLQAEKDAEDGEQSLDRYYACAEAVADGAKFAPILVDKFGVIIDGNHRVAALHDADDASTVDVLWARRGKTTMKPNTGGSMRKTRTIFDECFDVVDARFPDFGSIELHEDERAGADNGAGSERQFGYCKDSDPIVIAFAKKIEKLPSENIRGLMRHEFGHALDFRYGRELGKKLGVRLPSGVERRADAIAEAVFGDTIKYDGRLIQCVGCEGVSPRPRKLGP